MQFLKTLFFFFQTLVAKEKHPAFNLINKVIRFWDDNMATKVCEIAENKVFL